MAANYVFKILHNGMSFTLNLYFSRPATVLVAAL
jgi:hypothetical protein